MRDVSLEGRHGQPARYAGARRFHGRGRALPARARWRGRRVLAPAKGSRRRAKRSGGRPIATKCRGWRSSTSSTAKGPIFKACSRKSARGLAAHPIAIQIPVGQGPPHVANPFRGVIDLDRDEAAHVSRRTRSSREYSIDETAGRPAGRSRSLAAARCWKSSIRTATK